ncbi:MAG TPA: MmcQ-like protein [Cytophagales bacterium]|jgi:predicted DNA-binding protein (MmcQ/YjbR family)|nr:MmcQ-like protein [Cytophagales bacterium]
MNIEDFRDHCIQKPGVTESFPFDNDTLVFKVMDKMFALCNIENFESANLKCDPNLATKLREEYDGHVLPGYHMNKKHWNTVKVNTGIPDNKIKHWINHSYELVVSKLPKKQKEELKRRTVK